MLVKNFNKVGYYAKDGVNYETIIAKQDDPQINRRNELILMLI